MIDSAGLLRLHLIQRLQQPRPSGKPGWHAFGGGLKNGGISDSIMEQLSQIFEFEYMGAAEFEYGGVPETIEQLFKESKAGELVADQLKLPANRGSWMTAATEEYYNDSKGITRIKLHPPTKQQLKERLALPKHQLVYYICRREIQTEVGVFLRNISKENHYRKGYRFKMPPLLDLLLGNSYREPGSTTRATAGWIAIREQLMFFLDQEMFNKTKAFIGITDQEGKGKIKA